MLNMKSKIFKYIYAMLCLLPAIAVGVTCVYVANNDNAYQSYSGNVLESTDTYIATPKYTSNIISSVTDLVANNIYEFHGETLGSDYSGDEGYSSDESFLLEFELLSGEIDSIGYDFVLEDTATPFYNCNIIISIEYNTCSVNVFNGDGSLYSYYDNSTFFQNDLVVLFLGGSYTSTDNTFIVDLLSYTDYQEYTYTPYEFTNTSLDNVFYYSLDKVENSSVFSWVKSNFLYSGVNQFVGIFGGTNSNIAFYLTWVLTISLCYLGFEVLMLFINMARNLIHSFTDKDRW